MWLLSGQNEDLMVMSAICSKICGLAEFRGFYELFSVYNMALLSILHSVLYKCLDI